MKEIVILHRAVERAKNTPNLRIKDDLKQVMKSLAIEINIITQLQVNKNAKKDISVYKA